MIIALIIGFVTGWLISMPIGPVNATAISRTLKYGIWSGIATGIGAALMDFLYCAGAAQIHQFLLDSPLINLLFRIVGFGLLIYLGIHTLRTKTKVIPAAEAHQREELAEHRIEQLHMRVQQDSYVSAFMIGVVLYASNVAAVPEWIFVSALWREWGLLQTGVAVNITFALGAGIGPAGWFSFLSRFIAKRRHGFAPATLAKINLFTGIAMLVFALYFAYQIGFDTKWSDVHSHSAKAMEGIK